MMQISKATILQMVGLSTLVFFIAMAYYRNHIFLDKILLCSSIFVMLYILKIRDQINRTKTISNEYE
jgi:hypothetical protein